MGIFEVAGIKYACDIDLTLKLWDWHAMTFLTINPSQCLGMKLPNRIFSSGIARKINDEWAIAGLKLKSEDMNHHRGVYLVSYEHQVAFRMLKYAHTLYHPSVGVILCSLGHPARVLGLGDEIVDYIADKDGMKVVDVKRIVKEKGSLSEIGLQLFATTEDYGGLIITDVLRDFSIAGIYSR